MTTSAPPLPLNRREVAYYAFFASLLIAMLTFLALMYRYVTPRDMPFDPLYVGYIDEFSFGSPTMVSDLHKYEIYFVRTVDEENLVRAWTPFIRNDCCMHFEWVPRLEAFGTNSGAFWTLTGKYNAEISSQSYLVAGCKAYGVIVNDSGDVYINQNQFASNAVDYDFRYYKKDLRHRSREEHVNKRWDCWSSTE